MLELAGRLTRQVGCREKPREAAFDFVNSVMNAGRSDRTAGRRKWDLSTIFGVPKSCLHLQYPKSLGKEP